MSVVRLETMVLVGVKTNRAWGEEAMADLAAGRGREGAEKGAGQAFWRLREPV